MGNTKSQKVSNCEHHQRLGQVKLSETSDTTDQEGNPIEQMIVTKTVESEAQFNLWLNSMKKIDDPLTREVLLLPSKTEYQTTAMCGSSGVVKLRYEHYPYVFQMQIENRKKINRYFLQTQLWYLLYNLIRAGSKFEKYHAKIGDVHPNSILINNDGLIKIISTCSFPGEQTNFDKFMENPHEHVYLAPEELESALSSEYPKNIDPAIAQCYSIGLCMLAAGTLDNVDSVYFTVGDERKLQRHKVNYYLKMFGERYSSYLHSIVMSLLIDDPFTRKKCSDIYASLYEFQDKILDLQTFMPSNSRLVSSSHQGGFMNGGQQMGNSQYSSNSQMGRQAMSSYGQPFMGSPTNMGNSQNMYYSASRPISVNFTHNQQGRPQQSQAFVPNGSGHNFMRNSSSQFRN